MDDLPRGFIFFITVLAGDVEPKVVSGGFSQEVGAVKEGFDLVEFIFDQAVSGFHISLPSMGAGRNGLMSQAGDGFEGLGKGAWVFGLPAADEFGAIVGLKAALLEVNSAVLEVVDQDLPKEAGVGQRAFLGVGDEMESADDLAGGILHAGEIELADLGPQFGNVYQVFGIDASLLKELPGSLYRP